MASFTTDARKSQQVNTAPRGRFLALRESQGCCSRLRESAFGMARRVRARLEAGAGTSWASAEDHKAGCGSDGYLTQTPSTVRTKAVTFPRQQLPWGLRTSHAHRSFRTKVRMRSAEAEAAVASTSRPIWSSVTSKQ